MKRISIATAITCLMLSTLAEAEQTTRYSIAHTRQRDTNMVFVVLGSSFFSGDSNRQQRWYTSMQSCVRGANLAGEVVVVANVNGRFKYYGPKTWHNYLRTVDMAWVNARLNKKLTCSF